MYTASTFARRSLVLALAGASLFGVAATASASHSWNGYHWARTASSFTLLVGDNVSSTWDPILRTTMSDWTKSTVLDLGSTLGGANPKNCRGTTGRVEVCDSTYGYNGWLGLASISVTGGVHITKGSVKLNDSYFNTSTYNTTAWRNLVSCQEVGHTLGLDHQDENFDNPNLGTCMDYTSDPSTNQHPNQHDYDELITIYSHVDSTNTVGSSLPTGAAYEIDHNDRRTWGQLAKQSPDGRVSIYELDHGGGNKTVTFVIWALELGGRPQ